VNPPSAYHIKGVEKKIRSFAERKSGHLGQLIILEMVPLMKVGDPQQKEGGNFKFPRKGGGGRRRGKNRI